MIPKECKRLAEVDFPVAVVGRHSLAEKATRFGTPHQLHLWWAWRPLAACRAMLLSLLLPDPCDDACPKGFASKAGECLAKLYGGRDAKKKGGADANLDLRRRLIRFIGDFANWDNSSSDTWVQTARQLTAAAWGEERPIVLDSFAGSGSIPLEGLRVGCDAVAGELNSVAALILKVMLQDLQRHGNDLIDRVAPALAKLSGKAAEGLAVFYPKDSDGAQPIAYIWARTIRCEAPKCGAEIPLLRGLWLCTKGQRMLALKTRVARPRNGEPHVDFELFDPSGDGDVEPGTVNRAKARCPCCGNVVDKERVRAQLESQHGGADVLLDRQGRRVGGARLLAVVTIRKGITGRNYRLAVERDYSGVQAAHKAMEKCIQEWQKHGRRGPYPTPDEPLPPIGTLGFRVQRYGMLNWGHLFTIRQNLSLLHFARLCRSELTEDQRELAALCVSKLAERNNSICDWMMEVECPGHLYTQQVIPPAWDFAEAVPIGDSSGSFKLVVENTIENARSCCVAGAVVGDVQQSDACALPFPDESVGVFFTDPPYYDAVPYSDLSDLFFVWLKRVLPGHPLMRDPFDPRNPLTPKAREAVQDEAKTVNGKPKDRVFFENVMGRAFNEGRRVLRDDGVGCIVFAHKTTEGWEALLSGMINAKWVITGSWPILTERSARKRARDSAALATSVHLVCRPRPDNAPVGDWSDVLRELPRRVGDWMERLQRENIRGADLVFACIGPALEIYSRYSKVVDPGEREIPLGGDPTAKDPHKRGFLAYVWEVAGRAALEQVLGAKEARVRNGASGALEEDARLTALFLWTMQSTEAKDAEDAAENGDGETAENESDEDEEDKPKKKGKGFSLIFDVVRRFAQPLGIDLPKWEGRIIETDKGVVRLLAVSERAKQLFGADGAEEIDEREFAAGVRSAQGWLPGMEPEAKAPRVRGRRIKISDEAATQAGATTLDRVHAAMLLQSTGMTHALRALVKAEMDRGPDFLRLSNALSALYHALPVRSEDERLLDAMLLSVPK